MPQVFIMFKWTMNFQNYHHNIGEHILVILITVHNSSVFINTRLKIKINDMYTDHVFLYFFLKMRTFWNNCVTLNMNLVIIVHLR